MKQRAPLFFAISLVTIDVLMFGLAFFGGYRFRLQSDYENIQPFSAYSRRWGRCL